MQTKPQINKYKQNKIMKKVLLVLIALVATVCVNAQQIAVVKGSETKLYSSLKDAINGAEDGSVVYLPGGGFPIADSDTIKKKLTIIGISHTANSDNADGRTTINGKLFFGEGSSGSALMGCYVSGDVNIGVGAAVNDILLRYNNMNSVQVKNSQCRAIEINQCYVRNTSDMGRTNTKLTNNIIHSVKSVNGGLITNNIFTSNFYHYDGHYYYYAINADNTIVAYNVILTSGVTGSQQVWSVFSGSNSEIKHNMIRKKDWGDDCVNISDEWSDVFEKNAGVTPSSNYHFKEKYQEYEGDFLYGGTGFSKNALPPVPYISDCDIDEQTDAEGKLRVNIKVKAVTE